MVFYETLYKLITGDTFFPVRFTGPELTYREICYRHTDLTKEDVLNTLALEPAWLPPADAECSALAEPKAVMN